MAIQFTDVCFINEDVLRIRTFYEVIFSGTAEGDEVHYILIAGGVVFTFDYVAPLQENIGYDKVLAAAMNI